MNYTAPAVTVAPPPPSLAYVTFWSNDGTSANGGQPAGAVSLAVSNGLYAVLLGDSALASMTPIPATVFTNPDVRLRVWFNDGVNGFQLLTPDQRLAAVGYALMAANVPNGTITTAKLADGAVTGSKLAAGAVTSANIASNSITAEQLAPGAVSAANLAPGSAAANLQASGQSAVAQGGVILSSNYNDAGLATAGYVKLGKVDLGDVWEQRAGGSPPSARQEHTAVWTGSEMIVWGGQGLGALNDGGRYNPAANSWSALATAGAPVARWSTGHLDGARDDFLGRVSGHGHRQPLQSRVGYVGPRDSYERARGPLRSRGGLDGQ